MQILLHLAALSLMWLPTTSVKAAITEDEEPQVIEYGCQDLVAVGRIRTLSYTDLSTADDLIGHGRFLMRVDIRRVLRGNFPQRSVITSWVAHGQLRGDKDFLVVLSPAADGYVLVNARLWQSRPRPTVAKICKDARL